MEVDDVGQAIVSNRGDAVRLCVEVRRSVELGRKRRTANEGDGPDDCGVDRKVLNGSHFGKNGDQFGASPAHGAGGTHLYEGLGEEQLRPTR